MGAMKWAVVLWRFVVEIKRSGLQPFGCPYPNTILSTTVCLASNMDLYAAAGPACR